MTIHLTTAVRRFAGVAMLALLAAIRVPAQTTPVTVTNLVSNQPGVAAFQDTNLVNAWGLAAGPTSPFWISANGAGVSTIYTGTGATARPPVVIPAPRVGKTSTPTGIVFNGSGDFRFVKAGVVTRAIFIFSTEDGTIAAWGGGNTATIVANRSPNGAVYKGLAIVATPVGRFLLATDFHHNAVDVYNSHFHRVHHFTDSSLPAGYAPFGIATLGSLIYITFALQDSDGGDDVAGAGHGFVDVVDPVNGTFTRLISQGALNSPWGLAIAPASFGPLAGALLVGNFGDGTIHVYNPTTGEMLATVADSLGNPVVIDGLWALVPGNDALAGSSQTLFFTAGPDDESNGLFGAIDPIPGE